MQEHNKDNTDEFALVSWAVLRLLGVQVALLDGNKEVTRSEPFKMKLIGNKAVNVEDIFFRLSIGHITGYILYVAGSNNKIIAEAQFTTEKQVCYGDTVRFAAGDLTLEL